MRTYLGRRECLPRLGLALVLSATLTALASAQTATRDLTAFTDQGVPFTVSIAIQTPPGTAVVALEDAPPFGWVVSNISDGGSWDEQAGEVKWGLFFDPSIPASVTYTVTPGGGAGEFCFSGLASFDGLNVTTDGDSCLSVGIPTVSQWGLITLGLLVLTSGAVLLRRRVIAETA